MTDLFGSHIIIKIVGGEFGVIRLVVHVKTLEDTFVYQHPSSVLHGVLLSLLLASEFYNLDIP